MSADQWWCARFTAGRPALPITALAPYRCLPYGVPMTVADVAPPPRAASPASRPAALRWAAGVLVALVMLVAGGIIGLSYYVDSVPAPAERAVRHPVVSTAELPPVVAYAFVAAADPGFFGSGGGAPWAAAQLTRRYALTAADGSAGDESSLRTRIMAHKLEKMYTRTEILDRFLNTADYGRGAVGLVAAAQTYFGKQAAQLTLAEAAVLAVQLHPDRPAPEAGWAEVLDTMVDRGWLSPAERSTATFPG